MFSRSFDSSLLNLSLKPLAPTIECGLLCLCDRDPAALSREVPTFCDVSGATEESLTSVFASNRSTDIFVRLQ